MRLKNKKTGEIIEIVIVDHGAEWEMRNVDTNEGIQTYDSLAGLNAEWEDYEEPKEYWYIDDAGVIQIDQVLSSEINMRKSIGNYFETREEAEKAVEKLKAWKRLKDKGFRFEDYDNISSTISWRVKDIDSSAYELQKDLDLLFGGEE